MSIIRLQHVELIDHVATKCIACNSDVTARKLEVLYEANQTRKQTVYLLTDVLYCKKCDKGYVLSAFQKMLDSNNRSWVIQSRSVSAGPSHPTQSKPNPQVISTSEPQGQSAEKIKLDFIDSILPDHAETCLRCGAIPVKYNVALKIKKDSQSEYIPCTAWKCSLCREWMMRNSHYHLLQNNYSPYSIHVKRTATILHASKVQKHKVSHSAKENTKNDQFNRYGVFKHSPADRKGYFQE